MSGDFYIERKLHEGWTAFVDRGYRDRSPGDNIHSVMGESGIEWNVAYPFEESDEAIEAAEAFRRAHPGARNLRVIDKNDDVIWEEGVPGIFVSEVTFEMSVEATLNINPQEVSMIEQQPLHVPREALIETLQSNLDAEKAERKKAQDAITARRQAAQDAVASLSPDELLNLVQKSYGADLDAIVQMVEEAQKSGRLKSSEQKAGPKETSLEKWVRVLNLASDDTIEVAPTDPVYALL